MPNIGLQLYTVRDAMQKDFVGTLRQVARIGYAGIEGGGTGPLSREEYAKLLKELGITQPASGGGLEMIEKQGAAVLAPMAAAGVKYMMVSSGLKTADEYRAFAGRLNVCGKTCLKHGITLQYHNHAHEFAPIDGTTGHEILVKATDPALVWFQVDAGWVNWAGQDAPALIRRLKGRIRTIHVKDHTPEPNKTFTEVGTGALPLAEVVKAAKEIGVEWCFVEQDTCARPSLESAEISFKNLKQAIG